MQKNDIESILFPLITADGCSTNDRHIYQCRPLIKTTGDTTTEYGFSISLFGTVAMHCQYKGKWSTCIDVSAHCYRTLTTTGIHYGQNEWVHVPADPMTLPDLVTSIYRYFRNNATSEFDCCSRYEACSDAGRCINPDPSRGLLCSYRKKLENGIVFYGKNKNTP